MINDVNNFTYFIKVQPINAASPSRFTSLDFMCHKAQYGYVETDGNYRKIIAARNRMQVAYYECILFHLSSTNDIDD